MGMFYEKARLHLKKFLLNYRKISKTTRTVFSTLLILIAILSLAFASTLFVLYKGASRELALSLDVLESQERAITALALKLRDLEDASFAANSQTKNLTLALTAEQKAREKLIADQKDIQTKTIGLEQSIKDTSAPNLPKIVETWRDKVVPLSCDVMVNSVPATKNGSGTIAFIDGKVVIVTNKHVVVESNATASSCTATIAGKDIKIRRSDIEISPKADTAFLTLPENPAYTAIAITFTRCPAPAHVGDPVVILGFPSIGSKAQLTATEGIVSSLEDDHYVTSAKVERGNSGGAAILSKHNCYIGIPTFVKKGTIEALARILKQELVFNH
jgi:hypothetical protein